LKNARKIQLDMIDHNTRELQPPEGLPANPPEP